MKKVIPILFILLTLIGISFNNIEVHGESLSKLKDPQLILACRDFSSSKHHFKRAKRMSGYALYLHKKRLIKKRKITQRKKIYLQESLFENRLTSEYFQDNDINELIKMKYPSNFIKV